MDSETYKSVVLKGYGGNNQIEIVQHPHVKPGLDEVEVDVHYCGVNFCDIVTRIGLLNIKNPPFVMGIECSGIVTDVGETKENDEKYPMFKIGDKVICYDFTGGMYKERITVSRKKCYLLPENVSLQHGAAIFVNYLTAYFTLFDIGNLKSNENILISSCAGGVGWAATQLAQTIPNITMFGTASESKHEEVKKNGLTFPSTYEKIYDTIEKNSSNGIDLIIETQDGIDCSKNRSLLNPFGRIVIIGSNNAVNNVKKISLLGLLKIGWNHKHIEAKELIANTRIIGGLHLGVICEKERVRVNKALEKLGQLYTEGKIKPRIDSEWKIDDFPQAIEYMEERKNIGKILLAFPKNLN